MFSSGPFNSLGNLRFSFCRAAACYVVDSQSPELVLSCLVLSINLTGLQIDKGALQLHIGRGSAARSAGDIGPRGCE